MATKARQDPERFAGKINVPGSKVMLKDWQPADVAVRQGADMPSRHNANGRPGKSQEADVAGREYLKKK